MLEEKIIDKLIAGAGIPSIINFFGLPGVEHLVIAENFVALQPQSELVFLGEVSENRDLFVT